MEPLFNKICEETYAYATRQLNNPNRKKLKDDNKWFDTTADEIRAYFALVISMSQVRKSRIQLWQCKKCGVALHLEECFEVYHTQKSY
jgi:ribosomal protein L37AE/L43A